MSNIQDNPEWKMSKMTNQNGSIPKAPKQKHKLRATCKRAD